MRKNDNDKTLLRNAGFRVTKSRLKLLAALRDAEAPMSVKEIAAKLSGEVDQVTVYRSLEALHRADIVSRVDLQQSSAHYELSAGMGHHHHLVCNSCGDIEDISYCPFPNKIDTKKFAAIQSHSFELFGLCNACARSNN